MKNWYLVWIALLAISLLIFSGCNSGTQYHLFPENRAKNVNPDTQLSIVFESEPILGDSGMIRVYDALSDIIVDSLDLSIAPGPTTPYRGSKSPYADRPYDYTRVQMLSNADTKPGTASGVAAATSDSFQLNIIGGFTDAFHFYPVILRGNKAKIYLHNNMLDYGKEYYVTIDPDVLSLADGSFKGINPKNQWLFSTKESAPVLRSLEMVSKQHESAEANQDTKSDLQTAGADTIFVSAHGTGDFNTLQGALDFVPDNSLVPITIFVENGDYEELVYFRNKSNITILGENRDSVVVHYANNEVFNPHPADVSTNEWPGTFPSRRAAFSADNCYDICISTMTIMTTCKGQAEGLLIMGARNILKNVRIVGDGDALQTNGSLYMEDCEIDGGGDTMLGRGPAFLSKCRIKNNGGPFMWIRNTSANHGFVFVNCIFEGNKNRSSLARAPKNGSNFYPYAEAVLINCALAGIKDVGWGSVGGDTRNMHYWEYNSTKLIDGTPVDISQRHPVSRQLTMEKDSAIIADFSNPSFVLGGWTPRVL